MTAVAPKPGADDASEWRTRLRQPHGLRAARDQRNLGQREVADLLDVGLRTVVRWESSGVPRSRVPTVIAALRLDGPSVDPRVPIPFPQPASEIVGPRFTDLEDRVVQVISDGLQNGDAKDPHWATVAKTLLEHLRTAR